MLAGSGRLASSACSEAARFMSLTHNDRVKLTAVWLNTLSAAAVAAGVIAPLRFYGVTAAPVAPALLYLGFGLWFFAGIGLHLAARWLLGSLRE